VRLVVLKFVYSLCWWLQSDNAVSAHVNREVLTGEIPYAGFTPLQAAIGVVQRSEHPLFGHQFVNSSSKFECSGFSIFVTV
jgi:hypothetical protein